MEFAALPKHQRELIESEVSPAHMKTFMEMLGEVAETGETKIDDTYARVPVDIRTFMEDEEYMNKRDEIYPKVMDELIELNSGKYVESVITGAIGSAKTTLALLTQAYQLYLLSCLKNPHEVFGLDRASEILIVFQNLNERLAKTVDYARFKSMIEDCHYFKTKFPFDKDIQSKLVFPNRIQVVPLSGLDTAAIGQNIIGGILDEVNYMTVTEKSKQSIDAGTYDQAIALYNTIARRRESRFMKMGWLPGMLCIVSSKRYPGQFTDIKEEEARTNERIFVYDKRPWEIKPEGTYSGEWFYVFIGDDTRKPRILDDDEEVIPKDRNLVKPIPVEYRHSFESDPMNALREIAGVSTLSRFPFIVSTEKVAACIGRVQSIANLFETDFVTSRLQLYPKRIERLEEPRFAHIDLGLTSDSAGICVGHISRFISLVRGDLKEILPEITIDLTLEVLPPKGGEILFYKIRALLSKLKELGVNLRWVSFDSFQSVDSMQLLRQQGFSSGHQSMDTTPLPYELTKSAIYDGRLLLPPHVKLGKELATLEQDPKTGKIDHPPKGSKDVADALAGVVYGLTNRRELWARHGVPPTHIPLSIVAKFREVENKIKEAEDD